MCIFIKKSFHLLRFGIKFNNNNEKQKKKQIYIILVGTSTT